MSSSPLYLSPLELCNSIENSNDVAEITELLDNHPHLHPRFVHFHSIYRTIVNLERLVEQQRKELHAVFDNMKQFDLDNAVSPFIIRKRKEHLTSHRKRTRQLSPTASEYEYYSDGRSQQPSSNPSKQRRQRALRSHKTPSLLPTPHPMTRRSKRTRRLSSPRESLEV